MTRATTLDEHGASARDPNRWRSLAVLCLSVLIIFVGNSSLNVAIPTLFRELRATEAELQWVVASYALTFAGLLFLAGAIGDRYGRKTALQCGLVGFLLAAILAAASTTVWQLVGCRAVMGIAAAFIMPSTLSILVTVFPPRERPKAIALWAGTIGAAGVVGPLASGWLLGHFWYGAVFLINVPIVVLALVSGWILLPNSKDPEQGKLDPVGAALSVVGISAVVLGLIEAPAKGWGDAETLAAFALGAIVLAVFVVWELRVEEPMLEIGYFRAPEFSTGTVGMFLVFMSMFGMMFLITQYLQLVLSYSPFSAALRLLPLAPLMLGASSATPAILSLIGAKPTVASGMLTIAAGLLMLRTLSIDTPYGYLLLCLVPLVVGIGISAAPMTTAIMAAVPARRAGAGSAANDATRELGAALGVAVLGSVAAWRYGGCLDHVLHLVPAADRGTVRGSLAGAMQVADTLPLLSRLVVTLAARQAWVEGIHLAVAGGAVLTTAAAFIVWRYLPNELTVREPPSPLGSRAAKPPWEPANVTAALTDDADTTTSDCDGAVAQFDVAAVK